MHDGTYWERGQGTHTHKKSHLHQQSRLLEKITPRTGPGRQISLETSRTK